MEWNYLSIPKLQLWNRWSLGMDKWFNLTLYSVCDYLSMLGLKLNHVYKRGSRYRQHRGLVSIHKKNNFPGMRIPMIKIRWSPDHLIFIMVIHTFKNGIFKLKRPIKFILFDHCDKSNLTIKKMMFCRPPDLWQTACLVPVTFHKNYLRSECASDLKFILQKNDLVV